MSIRFRRAAAQAGGARWAGLQTAAEAEAFPGVPVRAVEEILTGITSPTNGVYIFNLGQNFAGVARLKVKGPAGTRVRLRYGEMLHPDGRLMTENRKAARRITTPCAATR